MPETNPRLDDIPPDRIDPNPDNPRIIFREDQMNQLLDSIREVGIKVPLSVYPDGHRYILIDGERRWRCARKLNLPTVPALVQPRPSRLENILMMFNIHNVRVDWDPLPTAIKLKQVQDLLAAEGRPNDLRELSALTGIRPVRLRRLFELLDLPEKYKRLLLRESEKPRDQREFTEDLFLEIYKALHAIERYTPEVFDSVSREDFVESMVHKYQMGAAESVTAYRFISKMARAELAGIDRESAIPTIVDLVSNHDSPIGQAFETSVGAAYERRDLTARLRSLSDRLRSLKTGRSLDNETVELLVGLRTEIDRLVGSRK